MSLLDRTYLLKIHQSNEFQSLKQLDLSGKKITSIQKNVFQGLKSLEKLSLKNNSIKELDPKSFSGLLSLKKLNVNTNKLERIDSNVLSETLSKLQVLNLSENEINEIGSMAFQNLATLKELNLSSNKLTKIDLNLFKGLKCLKELHLSRNSLVDISSRSFQDLSNLKVLKLDNNKLKSINLETLKGLKSLQQLDLASNEIELINPNSFGDLSSLKGMQLWSNKLKRIEANTFKGLGNLEGLGLSWNQIEEIEIGAFDHMKCLNGLMLSNNNLKVIDSTMLRALSNLQRLYLSSNELNEIRSDAFEGCYSSLVVLDLSTNKLDKISSQSFVGFKSIGAIALFDNPFGSRVISFFNPTGLPPNYSTFLNEVKIVECGFLTDWSRFLQQLDENDPPLDSSSQFLDSLRAPIYNNRYKEKNFLGEGNFGKIYLVFDEIDNKDKAMKISAKDQDEFPHRFVESLIEMKHENLIQFFEFFNQTIDESEYICIVFEFCENGSLESRINQAISSEPRKAFHRLQIFDWIFQSASALKYIHSNEVKLVHNNIKPSNMLLSRFNTIKLCDLISESLFRNHYDKFYQTSYPYMSPEHETFTKSSDIWSLGCVMYELLFLEKAFPNGQKDNPKLPEFPQLDILAEILKKMLVKDPQKRIDAQKLYVQFLAIQHVMDHFM